MQRPPAVALGRQRGLVTRAAAASSAIAKLMPTRLAVPCDVGPSRGTRAAPTDVAWTSAQRSPWCGHPRRHLSEATSPFCYQGAAASSAAADDTLVPPPTLLALPCDMGPFCGIHAVAVATWPLCCTVHVLQSSSRLALRFASGLAHSSRWLLALEKRPLLPP
eukprot:NODE_4627_length_655_cov_311.131667.p3 GENE.NODE_4627_length_655_cov_311.131667~~NODE_4627_length_655_cov_311.131667.p3  ORF type:complete len:163 (+),score=21.92 NODE_4627_length_655_cov_311.131667:81-569(+)